MALAVSTRLGLRRPGEPIRQRDLWTFDHHDNVHRSVRRKFLVWTDGTAKLSWHPATARDKSVPEDPDARSFLHKPYQSEPKTSCAFTILESAGFDTKKCTSCLMASLPGDSYIVRAKQGVIWNNIEYNFDSPTQIFASCTKTLHSRYRCRI